MHLCVCVCVLYSNTIPIALTLSLLLAVSSHLLVTYMNAWTGDSCVRSDDNIHRHNTMYVTRI